MTTKKATLFGAALAVASIPTGGAYAADLTISLWGGGYAEDFTKHLIEPFEADNNVEIVVDGGRSSERLSKLIATKGRGTDVVFLSDFQMYEAYQRGLIANLNPENAPNLANLRDFAKDPMGGGSCPAFVVLGAGLAYNTDEFGDGAEFSWADLLRTDLKGKAGYPDIGISYATMLAVKMAELNGGGIDNIAPGLDAVKSAKDSIQFYQNAQILESVVRGDVSMAPELNIFVRKEDGIPMDFAWPEEGGIGIFNLMCVVEGSPNAELAEKFINYMMSDEVQTKLLVEQGETPVSANVDFSAVEPSSNSLSIDDLEKLNFWDIKTIAANKADWVQLWQETVIAN